MAPLDVKTKALFNIRVSLQEREDWKEAAAPRPVSKWLRQLANDEARRIAFERSGEAAQVREREKIQQTIRPQVIRPGDLTGFKPDPK